MTDILAKINARLASGPCCGFEYVSADFAQRHMSAVALHTSADVIYEYDNIPGCLQFCCTFLVQIDPICCSEAGTSRYKQNGAMGLASLWR